MVLELEKRLAERLRAVLKEKYNLEIGNIPLETPPDLRLGEIATPIALQLARTLRKAPKIIAQEIVTALGSIAGFARFEVAGAGYINAYLDRGAAARLTAGIPSHLSDKNKNVANAGHPAHAIVEHTSINPNKAAHIGHLRNAILGDTFVRLLRAAGYKVDVQNYIDNTGVQVADVVVGFLHLEGKSLAEVRALIADFERRAEGTRRQPADALYQGMTSVVPNESSVQEGALAPVTQLRPFDYYCWDLYARTSQWYTEGTPEEQAARKQLRLDTLHLIEQGGNATAEIADLISTAVLRRHLETMLRLGIEYDFLPRESEILHLKFWEAAFEKLKQTGVLYFENEGKNKGCWVMTRPGAEATEGTPTMTPKSSSVPMAPSPTSAKTLPTTSGSSACSAATSATSSSSLIPITSAGSRPSTARRNIRTSATPLPSTTSSMRASPTRRPTSSRPCAAWDTPSRPTTTPISATRWSRSLRAAPSSWATTSPKKIAAALYRSQRSQGLRRQGRRPHRQAHRRHAR